MLNEAFDIETFIIIQKISMASFGVLEKEFAVEDGFSIISVLVQRIARAVYLRGDMK